MYNFKKKSEQINKNKGYTCGLFQMQVAPCGTSILSQCINHCTLSIALTVSHLIDKQLGNVPSATKLATNQVGQFRTDHSGISQETGPQQVTTNL